MRELGSNENRDKIVAAIKDFWRTNQYAPDIRDIVRAAHIPQTTVYFHLRQLVKMGTIIWDGQGNSIRLAGTRIIFPE